MADGILQLNVASVVEDVLQQHGKRLYDIDLASRKAEEASFRRYEAAGWLRKMVGVVGGKDLAAQPSEEEFRLGLRSGIVLCNVLNKVQAGAIPKVVEAPSDSVAVPDGAALSAYQYFENVRNFLDAIEALGVPAFEASDLEQGGKASRIVNCILALKSYHEWQEGGGHGVWKFSGNSKPSSTGKSFFRKNSDLFVNSISKSGEKSLDNSCDDQEPNEMGTSNHSLQALVRQLLFDKNREDIPLIVENMLGKVMEEFEHRLIGHNEQIRADSRNNGVPGPPQPLARRESEDIRDSEEIETTIITKDDNSIRNGASEINPGESSGFSGNDVSDYRNNNTKQNQLVEHQQRGIQELKNTLHSTKEEMQMLQMKYLEEFNNLGKYMHGLAHAAAGYQKVFEENRKLYNQVQDLKGNIRVYCRVRPFLSGEQSRPSSVGDISERSISIITPSKYGKDTKKSFTFNRCFGPSSGQEEVFSDMQPLVRSVLDGYNVCIFAYGQTGSGKTYTMTGPDVLTKESLGVNFRALGDLFLISEQRKETVSYDVSVQMMEIYNEQVRDLLVTDGSLNKKLEILNNTKNGLNVPNANLVPVASTSDVINLMNLGHKNRAVSATAMNDRSSRSHSCLTVHVQGKDLASGTVLRGCMHLVDLAGSERVDKSEVVGDRLKEAVHINKSLSALGDVISSLAQKNAHVPYRNSKLTQLLQDSLGGQAKTLMFVHISPEPDALVETISTLKFAERVSTIELGAAKANKEGSDVKELKEQIASLKAALARKGGELGSPERTRHKSSGSSPLSSSWSSTSDFSKLDGLRSSSLSRRQSLDSQDLIIDEEKCASGDWVDKVIVNISSERRHSLDNGLATRTRYESTAADESDELESATSDSSELDYKIQLNVPRSHSMPNGVGSKLRKPSPIQKRSLIPAPPTKKVLKGGNSPLHKPVRKTASLDGRRKTTTGK